MTVRELIYLLGQFHPNSRVRIENPSAIGSTQKPLNNSDIVYNKPTRTVLIHIVED